MIVCRNELPPESHSVHKASFCILAYVQPYFIEKSVGIFKEFVCTVYY